MRIINNFLACHAVKINKVTDHSEEKQHHYIRNTHDLFVRAFLFTEFTAQFYIINIRLFIFSSAAFFLFGICLFHRNLVCNSLSGLFILSFSLRLFI